MSWIPGGTFRVTACSPKGVTREVIIADAKNLAEAKQRALEILMTLRTYTIELKADLDDEQADILKKLMRSTAKKMYAQAVFLARGNRSPEIVMHSEDFFEGTEQIDLYEEDEPEDTSEEPDDPEGNEEEVEPNPELVAAFVAGITGGKK